MGEVITPVKAATDERQKALWHYYLDETGKARWMCTNCHKVCQKYPKDKYYCSRCGCRMDFEA